jgi:hypothetical protein
MKLMMQCVIQISIMIYCTYLLLSEIPEQPPKTYITKDRSEYFRPSIQVEMDYADKTESVTEVYIRGGSRIYLCLV